MDLLYDYDVLLYSQSQAPTSPTPTNSPEGAAV
jgi:hypothetical protein